MQYYKSEYISIAKLIGKELKNVFNSKRTRGETLEEHYQIIYIMRELEAPLLKEQERDTFKRIKRALCSFSIARIKMVINSVEYKMMKALCWLPSNLCKSKKPQCSIQNHESLYPTGVTSELVREVKSALDHLDNNDFSKEV